MFSLHNQNSNEDKEHPGDVSYMASELLTLTSGIFGYSQILLLGNYGVLSEEQQNTIQHIQNLAGRAVFLLQVVKIAERIAVNQLYLQRTTVSILEIIEEATRNSKARCSYECLVDNLMATVDKSLVTVLFTALLDFIKHFIDSEHVINIRIERAEKISIYISFVTLEIELEKLVERIIKREQNHPLTIAYSILNAHGGDIQIHQQETGESILVVNLPSA